MDSGQEFTREWLYDIILDQMVYLLQVHGPDAPGGGPDAQVDGGEDEAAEAWAEESEDDGVLDAADAEDAELTALRDRLNDLRSSLTHALAGGTGATETRTPLTGASGGAP